MVVDKNTSTSDIEVRGVHGTGVYYFLENQFLNKSCQKGWKNLSFDVSIFCPYSPPPQY